MSTFFEKLTGSRSDPEERSSDFSEPEAILAKFGSKMPTRRLGDKATHLKIEDEDGGAETAAGDDEGELTVDIFDDGETIVIQSIVAGVKPDDLDISITEDSVTIRGVRERQEEVGDANYYYKELFWGSFSRSVILPEEIDPDSSEAHIRHGLLTIRLPKKRRGTVQKLKVKVT